MAAKKVSGRPYIMKALAFFAVGSLLAVGFQLLMNWAIQNSVRPQPGSPALSQLHSHRSGGREAAIPYHAEKLLENMSTEEKIFQLFVIRPEDLCGWGPVTECTDELIDALERKPVGGMIFFRDNLKDPQQVKDLLSGFQQGSVLSLFMGVDEEGGIVQRLGYNPQMGVTDYPPMGKTKSAEDARQIGLTLGTEIRALGFNLDFAPVADVNTNPDNPIIGTRAFSSDPEIAAEYVAACVEGFRASGTMSCLKHFPGHGDTKEDSHLGYAESTRSLQELEEAELLPFRSGIAAGAPIVMVGHISLPNASGNRLPASMSPFWMGSILREKLGYEGLIVTDALDMAAITNQYPDPGSSSLEAFLAGADLLLCPDSLSRGHAAILNAVKNGTISESRLNESVLRILTAKCRYGIIA